MNEHQQPVNIATMDCVVVEKIKLLSILLENKEKHELVFNIAQSGYWERARTVLGEKKVELGKALKEASAEVGHQFARISNKIDNGSRVDGESLQFKVNFNSYLGVSYPENHTEDYSRAIRKVELSIYENVKLNESEFEKYVLNNWEWKISFRNSTVSNAMCVSGYMPFVTGCYTKYAGVAFSGVESLY